MRGFQHVLIPVGLILMALTTRYLSSHDTGTVRGAFIIAVDGLMWVANLASDGLVALGIPRAKPVPGHRHACPYDLNPFVAFPADSFALGVVLVLTAHAYGLALYGLWVQRRRPACPPLPPIEEL